MKIFLDMDGVLSDFVGACEKLFKKKLYAKIKDFHDVPQILGLSEKEFWDNIADFPQSFWLDYMQPHHWAKLLLIECKKMVRDVFVATSPAEDPSCAKYKMRWIQRELGLTTKEVFITGSKHLLAASDRILIDDYETNIIKWEENGGIGILFPRPWNKLRKLSNECMKHTLKKLEKWSLIQ